MQRAEIAEFDDDEAGYLDWLSRNPQGFVINTPRGRPTNYMVLHRATCRSISQYNRMARPGGFTERDYIKICAPDVAGLQDWTRQHGRSDGSFSQVCQLCKPI